MISKEFLIELVVRTAQINNDIIIRYSQHFYDRLHDRSGHVTLTPDEVEPAIKKLSKIKKKLNMIPVGDQFWVIDHTYNVSLGLYHKLDDHGKIVIQIGTILTPNIDGSLSTPNGNLLPVIHMP